MARLIAQIIVSGGQILLRAFIRALKQEIEVSQDAARMRSRDTRSQRTGITLDEAKLILDVSDLDPNNINVKYKKLFDANEPSKGGSFYLQSKVYRAKERLDMELNNSDTTK